MKNRRGKIQPCGERPEYQLKSREKIKASRSIYFEKIEIEHRKLPSPVRTQRVELTIYNP